MDAYSQINAVSIMTGEACQGLTSEASCGCLPTCMLASSSIRCSAEASSHKANRANEANVCGPPDASVILLGLVIIRSDSCATFSGGPPNRRPLMDLERPAVLTTISSPTFRLILYSHPSLIQRLIIP